MTEKNIDILYSLLNQVGGPVSAKEIFIVDDVDLFYSKWGVFSKNYLNRIRSLSSAESDFLVRLCEKVYERLGLEAETAAGYSDKEIIDSIEELRNFLMVEPLMPGDSLLSVPSNFSS